MTDILELCNQYVRAELLVLVPILYIIGAILKNTSLDNKKIPFILLVISIVLCGIYTFAVLPVANWHNVLLAIFSTLVQGILLSGSTIGSSIMLHLLGKTPANGTPPSVPPDKPPT